MVQWRSKPVCERAAQWISLELDGELSEFERAALSRHLRRCEECSRARDGIAGFTRVIRDTPIVPVATLDQPIASPARRPRRSRRVAAACVLAAALGSTAAAILLPQSGPAQSSLALASATPSQRLRFAAAEHARIDPRLPTLTAPAPAPSPFAIRALIDSD